MSTMFERARLIGAVVICAVLFFLSTLALDGWKSFQVEPTPPEDVEGVHQAVQILSRARTPMRDIQPCDAVKAFLPKKFTTADGAVTMTQPSTKPVILCFNSDIDWGDSLKAANARRLFWQRGIGGEKFVVFAHDEASFLRVARENGLTFAPGELRVISPYLAKLAPHPRTRREGSGWLINPGEQGDGEATYGPYVDLAPGTYSLSLTFEPVGGTTCVQLLQQLRVRLSVSNKARANTILPEQPVTLEPYGNGCHLQGAATFTVKPGQDTELETPIWVGGPLPVKLTAYDLSRVS